MNLSTLRQTTNDYMTVRIKTIVLTAKHLSMGPGDLNKVYTSILSI